MIGLLFFALFIVVPVLELWLILQVGSLIGVLPTILLLLVDSIVGAWLVKSQGGQVWLRFRETAGAGRVPAGEAVDGFLVILGGTLLLVPGFLSDIAGLLMVLPPTRRLFRGRVIAFVSRRARVTFMGGDRAAGPGGGWSTAPGSDSDDLRDFAHSNQPRRRPAPTGHTREPDIDFDAHQLRE